MRIKPSHALGVVVVITGVTFGLVGGEYSTADWLQLKRTVDGQEEAVEQLRREIDSLRLLADSLETDSATIERVAREEFGMVRAGEVLFRIAEPNP